jgi:hypothetical protein
MMKTSERKLIRSTFLRQTLRIVFWIFLLVTAFILAIITSGYFAALKPQSFLPEVSESVLQANLSGMKEVNLSRSGYILSVDEIGSVSVKTIAGEVIMSNLRFYSSYERTDEKWGLDSVTVKLSSDSTIAISGKGASDVMVTILLTFPRNKSKLDIQVKSYYHSPTVVNREALVARFGIPLTEVYLKNRKLESGSFDSEYWLQRQGAKFGSGDKSALIYNSQGVSSLQVDTKRSLLFVNLEYCLDHPFINIPFQDDGGGRWVNLNKAEYKAGNEQIDDFSIYLGGFPKVTPRIMLLPNGFLSGYIFTEHADGGNISSHRAAYFGSEDITRIEDAKGGFAGYKIPVTKSVFYADPDRSLESSIKDEPEFIDFLDQLNKTGNYDICLHTPENLNSNRKLLGESIEFIHSKFDASTWIDHGMYSGKFNRESFVADGLNPNSEYYASDLWEKYNIKYFWNPAVEKDLEYSLKKELKKLRFFSVSKSLWRRYFSPQELDTLSLFSAYKELVNRYHESEELNSLLPGKGNAYPTPLFWQHPTRTGGFYSWVTDYAKSTSNFSAKKVLIEQELLNKLISDWGIFINHGYFVRTREDDNILIKQNGKLVINPFYDQVLELMAQMRTNGDLHITTIKDLLDYWILVEKISFEYKPDGHIDVYNGNTKPINGFSLVVNANNVTVNGETPKLKRVGTETVFWFDIGAGEHMILKIN